ncbi:flagellar biosynthesis protein FlhB [Paenibacillus cymbidii]|uniref:flagellar biosynthesis protein FlhB n=1 Tax=Paenibacillus cymbidii TaxID=1639034 RepID=UPI0010818B6A|nr:flagellar biosynthesis protein FlhB [Paenibacillus cymbidii]
MSRFRLSLDLQLFAQEKTEPATPKKRSEARKKGQVAKSGEIPSSFILLFGFLSFAMLGGFYKARIIGVFSETFYSYMLMDVTIANVTNMFGKLMVDSLVLLLPIFATSVLIAFLGNYLQFGLLFTGEPLKMKFSKLNPIEGAKRVFALRALVEFAKTLLKVTVVGVVVYIILIGQKEKLLSLAHVPLESAFVYVCQITLRLGLSIGAVLVVLAVLDYFYQRYEHEKGLRMSKQDIKDEYKKMEGDPLIKGKIKERQRRLALQRMMQDVPKADVIITNPTHFAVAVQYDGTKMEAPKVLAKGTDYVALRIREIAKEHGVMTMENKPLARALYAQVEIGQTIPAELFQAVAEVLAYVYKLKGKTKVK